MSGFSDIHGHFVYGVDDGAQTREDMEAMLDMAHATGIAALFSTPHITPGLKQFPEEDYRLHLAQARQYCQWKGYPIEIYAGAEVLYTPAARQYIRDRRLPTLAGSDHVLVEFVPNASLQEVTTALEQMSDAGYVTVLAHIERYDCMNSYRTVRNLKEQFDIRYQLNCASVVEGRGFFKTRLIHRWLKDGLIDFVASDAHGSKWRPFRMHEAYDALLPLVGEDAAARLTGIE